jgi:hypothetical protein
MSFAYFATDQNLLLTDLHKPPKKKANPKVCLLNPALAALID